MERRDVDTNSVLDTTCGLDINLKFNARWLGGLWIRDAGF